MDKPKVSPQGAFNAVAPELHRSGLGHIPIALQCDVLVVKTYLVSHNCNLMTIPRLFALFLNDDVACKQTEENSILMVSACGENVFSNIRT